jgi:hypothetical protein
MGSGLFDLLMQEREAELRETYETKLREQQAQFRQQEEQFRQELQQMLEDTLLVRFPAAPLVLMRDIRRVHSLPELRRLIVAVQQVPDLAVAEQLLHAAAQPSENGA